MMSVEGRFSADEWRLVRSAPVLIGTGMVAADPGGIVNLVKEAAAMGATTRAVLKEHRDDALLTAIVEAGDEEMKDEMDAVLGGAESAMDKRERLQSGALDRLRTALEILERKAEPGELRAYKHWVGEMARRVAEAGKEGGFMGFGGVRVTESERRFLDRVEQLVG